MNGTACVMFDDNFTLQQALDECYQGRDKINGFIADIHKQMKQEAPQPKNMKTTLFPIVRDFNVMLGAHWIAEDMLPIFGQQPVLGLGNNDIYDILVAAGAFESKGQARKNWTGVKEIPVGYSEIGPIGKQKLMLFIWNPTE